jgi:hypothetical protein
MRLITEVVEQVKYIAEEGSEGKKSLFIEGVFLQGNLKNRNGRKYPTDLLAKEVDRYRTEQIEKNRAYGELGHPSGPSINLERVSHLIKSLRQEGDNFVGRAKIMDTPYGNIVSNLMKEGAVLGVSSRGMGSLVEKNGVMEVQNDFFLATAADIVADPSAPDAFVNGVMEGVEWVWDNGVLRARELEKAKKHIEEAAAKVNKKELEEAKIRVFKHFLSNM